MGSMKNILLVLLFCLASASADAQIFTEKYKKLTDKNLKAFFKDWSNWSRDYFGNSDVDSLSMIYSSILKKSRQDNSSKSKNVRMEYESLLKLKEKKDIDGEQLAEIKDRLKELKGQLEPGYMSLPNEVRITCYEGKYDINDPAYSNSDDRVIVRVAKCILAPQTGEKVLFTTDKISDLLERYCSGNKKNGKTKSKNVQKVKNYVPVDGVDNGYFHFESMPMVTRIRVYENGKLVDIRTSWSNGYSLFFPNGETDANKARVLKTWN